jgi:hypothetical protein
MTSTKAQIIKDAIAQAGSTFVSVYFHKKDGTIRQMTFNPKHHGIVLGTGNPLKDPGAIENIVRCMDICAGGKTAAGWRSFDCRRVFRMSVGGRVMEFEE